MAAPARKSASKAVARGAFIVFEGVDRSGKSTQSENLVKNLQATGIDAELWRFPDRKSTTGKMLDSYLRSESEIDDAAIHLLFSANRWEKKQQLLEKLQAGITLIVDRYAYSGAVFTAAKRLPGLDLDWSKAPDQGLPAPDAVLFMDLSVEAAARRGDYGNERYENLELQHEVRKLYGVLQKDVCGWHTINADQPIEALSQEIKDAGLRIVRRCKEQQSDLKRLWT